MWYYAYEHQQQGPIDESELSKLITEAKIKTTTLVWKKGMENWSPAGLTELAPFFEQGQPPSIQHVRSIPITNNTQVQIQELNDLFRWYWICLIGSVFTFGLSAIASIVLFYIILYHSWNLIQDDGFARTTPGKAVGYSFIPFFNFYWIFQSIAGLTRDTNAYIKRHSLPVVQQDENLTTIFCVILLLCMVPYLNIVTGLIALILQIIVLKNYRDTSIALLMARSK